MLREAYLTALPPQVRARIRATAGGCHVWTGPMSGATLGGGVAAIDGVYGFVHRAVWRLNRGPLPPGQIVVRVCRNRRCVRLDHLRATTASAWLRHILRGDGFA